MSALATLGALQERGYWATLDRAELVVRGPGPVPEDLRTEIRADTTAVKAAVLLANPPAWLSKLFELWYSGHTTHARRTDPATGQVKEYPVHVSIKNIAAAVAAAVGMDALEWEAVREEVEEALGSWDSLG